MTSKRASTGLQMPQSRPGSVRQYSRVTKEDIRSACLRRWDGRARVTTDWVNLFYEPELHFPNGDLLIYLREPGQSSRGPAFRVHQALLKERGFDFLLEKCISRPPILPETNCLEPSCYGCDKHSSPAELYIPAPTNADLDETFDHHIASRNFFAWLYDLPLAGRALGRSLVTLKQRIDYYRPYDLDRASLEVVSFAESQGYLDFRECVDHALAALLLAEYLQIEDLWIDAFSHCAGMSHRGLKHSLEYWAISYDTRVLINKAQNGIEAQRKSVRETVRCFFETTLSDNLLGLSHAAREHIDHFRSWLHSYHIERYGFWPPEGFEDESVERQLYALMYSDFGNLYHHLVDPTSTTGITDLYLSDSGGVCTIQNIQAFDIRNNYESLPQIMTLLPREPSFVEKKFGKQPLKSWSKLVNRKTDKDNRRVLRAQALIKASNRDWAIMGCPLVRRFSEYEAQTVMDETETVSMVEGRKVRWILIYAILQTILSVMRAPRQVRNTEGLTYLLCCNLPDLMPWQTHPQRKRPILHERRSMIEPDVQYSHSNSTSNEFLSKPPVPPSRLVKDKRRQSLPARISSIASRPSTARSASFKRLVSRRNSFKEDAPAMPKSPGFCEILVQGYGNGLNEVQYDVSSIEDSGIDVPIDNDASKPRPPLAPLVTDHDHESTSESDSPSLVGVPELTPILSDSISRGSSIISSRSSWSKDTPAGAKEAAHIPLNIVKNKQQLTLPDSNSHSGQQKQTQHFESRHSTDGLARIVDEEGCTRVAHFNTSTWDNLLDRGYEVPSSHVFDQS